MHDLPSVLLWAFATCLAAVMMATLIRRRREQLTGQLRSYVGRHLGPPPDASDAADATGTADATGAPAGQGSPARLKFPAQQNPGDQQNSTDPIDSPS